MGPHTSLISQQGSGAPAACRGAQPLHGAFNQAGGAADTSCHTEGSIAGVWERPAKGSRHVGAEVRPDHSAPSTPPSAATAQLL